MSSTTHSAGGTLVARLLVAATSVCLTMLVLEVALRVHSGKPLEFKSLTAEPRTPPSRLAYDPELGWAPIPGEFDGGAHVEASTLRSTGRSDPPGGRPVMVVGDSFTYGDDVADRETWAAGLEGLLDRRVLNAGVSAYGIDQAVRRAELLFDGYHPDLLILSFIADDVDRTEFSYYAYGYGWKPYFEEVNGALTLRNVPVPQGPINLPFPTLRHTLSYSYLADMVLDRVARRWWRNRPVSERVHRAGDHVSVVLIARLDAFAKLRGCRFLAVALATSGRIGNNDRLSSVVKGLREKGVVTLDLAAETLKLPPSELRKRFVSSGHYTPAMNTWVAGRIAAFVHDGLGSATSVSTGP